MEFTLKNVGIIKNSTIRLNGLTVITGTNDSGKSTAGKALYATIEGLDNLSDKKQKDLKHNFYRFKSEITRRLNLRSIMAHIDLRKESEFGNNILSALATGMTINMEYKTDITAEVQQYKEMLELLDKDYILEFTVSEEGKIPERVKAYLDNFDNVKARVLSLLDRLNPFLSDDISDYAKNSLISQFRAEFSGQIFPNALKSEIKESEVILGTNPQLGCKFKIRDNKEIFDSSDLLDNSFFKNVILIDNAFIIDGLLYNGFFYGHLQAANTHTENLKNLLTEKRESSLIEEKINEQNYNEIISHMSSVVAGDLAFKDGQVVYVAGDNELRAENLATGSKVFAIIKSLIKNGKIDLDTMLILDEPESHLHPAWQNEFAEIIILLVKVLGVNVLLTTHSPNFLLALDTMAKKYKLNDKFAVYVSEKLADNYMVEFKDVSQNIEYAFSHLAQPYLYMDTLRYKSESED